MRYGKKIEPLTAEELALRVILTHVRLELERTDPNIECAFDDAAAFVLRSVEPRSRDEFGYNLKAVRVVEVMRAKWLSNKGPSLVPDIHLISPVLSRYDTEALPLELQSQ